MSPMTTEPHFGPAYLIETDEVMFDYMLLLLNTWYFNLACSSAGETAKLIS